MSKAIPIDHQIVANVLVLSPPEMALDAASAPSFKDSLHPWLEKHGQVVLNLQRIRFVDSAGLGVILGALRAVQAKKGDLKVCGLSQTVRSLFEMVRFHRVVELFPDVDEAVRAFEKP